VVENLLTTAQVRALSGRAGGEEGERHAMASFESRLHALEDRIATLSAAIERLEKAIGDR
jgi:hypothetical protein